MGKFKIEKFKKTKKSWLETIIDRIGDGRVLPIIGNRVNNDLIFGSHDDLVEGWAEYTDYPVGEASEKAFIQERLNLSLMTQYQRVMNKADPELRADDSQIKEMFLNFLQKVLFSKADEDLVEDLIGDVNWGEMSFTDLALQLEKPPLTNMEANPLLLLADLPFPIYLTTSYDHLMEAALKKAGKSPRSEICYWTKSLERIPSVFEIDEKYKPSKEEPLVFHLYGSDEHTDSLVLTEDDHVDFLVTISEKKEAIALRVRDAIAGSSLLMLGYSLRSWDFRVLFRGLIKTSENARRTTSVSIQLSENEIEKEFLKNYLTQDGEFEVYWGDSLEFIRKIHQGWNQ